MVASYSLNSGASRCPDIRSNARSSGSWSIWGGYNV